MTHQNKAKICCRFLQPPKSILPFLVEKVDTGGQDQKLLVTVRQDPLSDEVSHLNLKILRSQADFPARACHMKISLSPLLSSQ